MSQTRKITGTKLGSVIAEAMGLDPAGIKRIVIDIQPHSVVMLYVEHYGDERLLEIDWAGELKETRITEGGGSFVTSAPNIPLLGDGPFPGQEIVTVTKLRKPPPLPKPPKEAVIRRYGV